MKVTVMQSAEGYDVFVTDFLAEAAALSKAQVMGVGRLTVADEARQLCNAP